MFFGASPVFFGIPTNGQRFPRVTPTETWQQSSRCVSARFASALGSQGGAASDDAAGAGSYPATRAGNGDLQAGNVRHWSGEVVVRVARWCYLRDCYFKGTLRIPNHRAPNQHLSISWLCVVVDFWCSFDGWTFFWDFLKEIHCFWSTPQKTNMEPKIDGFS